MEAVLQLHQIGQRCHVPVHAENRFGDQEGAPEGASMFAQQPFQVFGVVMAEPEQLRPGGPNPVQQTGVAQSVGEHGVMPAHQSGDQADVRLVSGVENESGFLSLEGCCPCLQFMVQTQVAAHQAGGAGAGAILPKRRLGGGHKPGVLRQGQVVVGRQINVPAPVPLHLSRPAAFQAAQRAEGISAATLLKELLKLGFHASFTAARS